MPARPPLSSLPAALSLPTALEQEDRLGALPQPTEQEDRRGTERFRCSLPTTCQPPSSWCKDPWPATIRDISTNGLSLSLQRRFERGSGLAIELPTDDGTTATVLARVIYVRPFDEGGWLLGCSFISSLSDEEVRTVLELDHLQHATAVEEGGGVERAGGEGASPVTVAGVLFQARLRPGEVVRWYIKRLDLSGSWPLERDRVVTLHINGQQALPLALLVRKCAPLGEIWVVNARFQTDPPPEVLRALGCPV